ncbi:hypothetical protein [Synechococcus sp. BS56D]|uniref:hypothetical protein n=1 Tax=Synechococcus sp. BS56D TaxID=2055944 RepID=UPI00103A7DD8|nr:hypothetical protein [Synechococcus sp. BS56D]
MNSKLQKIFLTSTSFIFIFTGRAIASPGPSMVQKGNYWTCPSDNRVLPLDNIPESPGGAAHLRKWETNMYRASSFSLPLADSDAWIAIAKGNIGNLNSVTKTFLARDIKPQTSYTIKGYDLWRRGSYPRKSDRFIFQNADGTELSIVFDKHHYTPYYGHALDGRGNKIDIHTNHRGAFSLSCNTLDENLTYKSVYPFKMKLTNEYGESYDSPLLVMTVKYIIKPRYIQKAPGFAF